MCLSTTGSFGAAVTIVSSGEEERNLNYLELKCNTHIFPLPGKKNQI